MVVGEIQHQIGEEAVRKEWVPVQAIEAAWCFAVAKRCKTGMGCGTASLEMVEGKNVARLPSMQN